jgi:hypothetical protein
MPCAAALPAACAIFIDRDRDRPPCVRPGAHWRTMRPWKNVQPAHN